MRKIAMLMVMLVGLVVSLSAETTVIWMKSSAVRTYAYIYDTDTGYQIQAYNDANILIANQANVYIFGDDVTTVADNCKAILKYLDDDDDDHNDLVMRRNMLGQPTTKDIVAFNKLYKVSYYFMNGKDITQFKERHNFNK